jgi:hypothetical protein
MFQTSASDAVWHCLHELQEQPADILDAKQKLVAEYVRDSALHLVFFV